MTNSDKVDYPRAPPSCKWLRPLNPASQSHGLRLSWPYGSEHRRAIVSKSPAGSNTRLNIHDARILHISNEDIERHNRLTRGSSERKSIWQLLKLEIPMVPAVMVEVENQDRFQYFQHTASKALAIFGHDSIDLGNALIRIALASNTTSATAVRESILAFSALHRHSIHAQAIENKIAALKALKVTAASEIDTLEAIQHVAAGMLLCSFEIHLASCTSDDWMKYLRGVKDVIRAANLQKLDQYEDLAILLDWVYYHDVLARFSLRHWYRQFGKPTSAPFIVTCTTVNPTNHVSNWLDHSMNKTPSSLELVTLLSDLCETITSPLCGLTDTALEECKRFLEIVEWRIRNEAAPATTYENGAFSLVLELYKLAMLVYLNRVTKNQLKQTVNVQTHIDRGFEILTQLSTCERQFPVFIFGCEAQSDTQRAIILDIISSTECLASSRSLNHMRLLLQAIWAQDDLAEGKTNYWEKISCVISCCTIMPSFV